MDDEPNFNFTERKPSEVLKHRAPGLIKCASCRKLVSRLAVLCPECGKAAHSKGSLPWPAIVASGIVAAAAWVFIDRIVLPQPTSEQINVIDSQLKQSQKLLNDASAMLQEDIDRAAKAK